jgi:hypothetical protein
MNARRRISLLILLVLLPVTAFALWQGYQRLPAFASSALSPTAHASSPQAWKFKNEEHWLADETVRDISEMVAFAKHPGAEPALDLTLTPKAANSYDISAQFGGGIPKVATSLLLQESIWSPGDYAAWATQALSAAHVTAAPPTTTPYAWTTSLTQPAPQVLMAESQRLSKALSAAPLDAGLHEQAALLISAFALREAAGTFTNYRRELCRATAHLSLARALHPDVHTPAGDLAEAALATLAERNGPALEMLKKLESNRDLAIWINALRMRNIGDWHAERANPSALEQVEIFRARALNVGTDFALAWLKKQKGAIMLPDWDRIILESRFGVENGHAFVKTSIPQEIALVAYDWKNYSGNKLVEADLVKVLNEPAARCVSKGADGKAGLTVLGWDFWAGQHQRQLCQGIHATNEFMRDLWGVDEYKDVQKYAREHYAGLTLFPLVQREIADTATDYNALRVRATQLVVEHPELVNATLWADLNCATKGRFPAAALRLPDPGSWIAHYCPFGTAFEFSGRCYHYAVPEANEPAKWDALFALAPYNYEVLYSHVWKKFRDHPPIEAAETAMAPIAGFNLQAMHYLTNNEYQASPKYPETMERIAALDPTEYFSLGNYHVMHAQSERAAAAFKKGIELSPDRVAMANDCEWYVNYLEGHGRKAEALTIAQEAAEVYSSGGLETMARLMEKRGNLKSAEDYFQKIEERYKDKSQLNAFYIRHASEPQFSAKGAAARAQVYPRGQEKVALADLKTPPADGVRMVDSTPFATTLGLKRGDIFVGFDGVRIHNMGQFTDMRLHTSDPNVTYVVWNPQGYREVKTVLPRRLLGVQIDNWQAK